MNEKRDIYMIHVGEVSGSVFVKEYDYFKSRGGFVEEWGTHWKPVVATGIEHARFLGCKEPGARPYDRHPEYSLEIIEKYGGQK